VGLKRKNLDFVVEGGKGGGEKRGFSGKRRKGGEGGGRGIPLRGRGERREAQIPIGKKED